ncbi:MAG: translation initiation factor IF-1 [Gammaproteobacteria bacterium]|nr:translation initiation factor IF-1 [Gammaproteobacteria bacterium]
MPKEDVIEFDGTVVEVLPNTEFIVELKNGHRIHAHVSGKIRMKNIRILQGQQVKIEVSTYDTSRGRITWRYNSR